jgi:hypothetical protein
MIVAAIRLNSDEYFGYLTGEKVILINTICPLQKC